MHQPVLLQPVIEGLALAPGLTVVDGTINGAGHSLEIIKHIPGGHLIGIDRDETAIRTATARLRDAACRISFVVGNFRHLDQLLDGLNIELIDRLLLDLGLSSDQLADSNQSGAAGRGFSFQNDEPLLMTYEVNPMAGQLTAREIVNRWRESELAAIFADYGDEIFAKRIARAIVETRRAGPIKTTTDLVAVVRGAVPRWYRGQRRHFATKVFLALRIAVNDEFEALARGLEHGWRRLSPTGRLAVITFHSGEARLVKNFFRVRAASGAGAIITKKAIRPTYQELKENPRARSATLRLIQKNDH